MRGLTNYSSRFRILKGGKISLVVSAILGGVTLLSAAPSGGVVTAGSANISQGDSVTNITQSTQKASINWQSFGIKAGESVNFKQPNANSITLNRVVGNESSVINGALNANGQVWLLNSNGVLFGKGASINTSGLLATTAKLSDADFMSGNYNFKDATNASVINQGTIEVANGGYVVLASNEVRNEGTIKAIRASVHLRGASDYTLNLNGNSILGLKVNKGVLDALVENSGTIIADGGEIYLTTNAVDELLKGVVNNTGVIEANSIDDLTSHVELFAHGGTAQVGGTIEAKDGFVETSGKNFDFLGADIKAGEWLIDPVDITIDATLADAIETALGSGDVTIETVAYATPSNSDVDTTSGESAEGDGDSIYVNSDITWSSQHTLTLDSVNEIHVNATIENTNDVTGGVYFQAANDMGKVIFGANGKIIIHNPFQLQWMSTAKNGKYELGRNINLDVTSTWNVGDHDNDAGTPDVAMGFVPIGSSYVTRFDGTFDGKGYTIANLYTNRPGINNIGLFGYAGENAQISNVTFTAADVTGGDSVGILVGSGAPTVDTVQVDGSVTGNDYVGGMIGNTGWGIELTTVRSSATVTGRDAIGGLVGVLAAETGPGTITKAYATGNVTGRNGLGGLIGQAYAITLTADQLYARGNVSGENAVGGLIGYVADNMGLSNSYAWGDVTASGAFAGGLIGAVDGNNKIIAIDNSYSSGAVSASNFAAGFVGEVSDPTGYGGTPIINITDSFWDTEASGQTSTFHGGTGVTTAQLKSYDFLNDAGWDVRADASRPNFYALLNWDDADNKWSVGTQGTAPDPDSTPAPEPTPTPNPTPEPAPEPTTEPTPTPDDVAEVEKEVNDVIASITNQTATEVNLPKIEVQAPTPQTNTPKTTVFNSPDIDLGFGKGAKVALVSQPLDGEVTKRVTMSEIRGMQQDANPALSGSNVGQDTRVPLSENSIVDLVNGGVNLPDGVEQEFYVVKEK
jgi:filamentous hemagglutinin family protein